MIKVLSIGALGLMVAAANVQAAEVTVRFVDADDYTDAGYTSSMPTDAERDDVLHEIERHLKRLGERALPAGATLQVEILDIDLAGQMDPFRARGGTEVRIVRDVTGPRIKLRYALSRGNQVVTSDEEQLSDLNFLLGANRYSISDRLRYEKAMLDEWFAKRFGKR